jgi:hypothetical protein
MVIIAHNSWFDRGFVERYRTRDVPSMATVQLGTVLALEIAAKLFLGDQVLCPLEATGG